MNKVGIMVMSGFAVVWFVWGASAIRPLNGLWFLVPLAISGAMLAGAIRMKMVASAAQKREVGRIVGWASAIEGVAIFAAVNVIGNLGYSSYNVVTVLAIVGLHFLPLAHFLRVPVYYVTGAAMVGLAALGIFIGAETTRVLVLGVGAAVLLWLTCLVGFARDPALAAV